jgi:protein gp37
MSTKINWVTNTDGSPGVTVNPFPGCRKVSEGCQNCYAERMAQRLKAMGVPAYQKVIGSDGKWNGETSCAGAAFRIPGKGKMVFVNSMGDLFYERNPFVGGIDVLFDTMLSQPQHIFQILTKRPERALKYYREIIDFEQGQIGKSELANAPNIWLGATIENQKWADIRIPFLLQIPAAVRFVSMEPLLGPILLDKGPGEFLRCAQCGYTPADVAIQCDHGLCSGSGPGIHWVIVGCESGPGRRPCNPEWIKSIVRQCHDAGVPVFVKQMEVNGKVCHDAAQIAAALGISDAASIRQYPP